MSATQTKSSHAYGIGILVVIVALGVSITWYTSYWLPEENQKVFVDEHILFPDGETVVNIIMGSATPEQKDNYMPKTIQVQLTIDNRVIWKNVDEVHILLLLTVMILMRLQIHTVESLVQLVF